MEESSVVVSRRFCGEVGNPGLGWVTQEPQETIIQAVNHSVTNSLLSCTKGTVLGGDPKSRSPFSLTMPVGLAFSQISLVFYARLGIIRPRVEHWSSVKNPISK